MVKQWSFVEHFDGLGMCDGLGMGLVGGPGMGISWSCNVYCSLCFIKLVFCDGQVVANS